MMRFSAFLEQKNWVIFLLLCLCNSLSFGSIARAETELLLEPPPVLENNPIFAALQDKEAETKTLESKKIEYLLDRIMHSTCTFIRNGENFPGNIAAQHMRWKYSRYYNEIKTAVDFAKKIASSSRKTREKYKIKMSNGKTHNADKILLNELAYLDRALKHTQSATYNSSSAKTSVSAGAGK